ncbi:MAG: hypothetical protein KGL39_04185 [Patescibacteria group bacterium]|nr:hypothetical protein [Patescibacteria group bacterium]
MSEIKRWSGNAQEGQTKARAIFKAFHAAGFRPEYGWDEEAAVEMWGNAFRTRELKLLLRVAEDWVSQSTDRDFPTLPEFKSSVESAEKALFAAERAANREKGHECPECFDGPENRTDGFVDVTPLERRQADPFAFEVRPCSICKPVQYDLWKKNHYAVHMSGTVHNCRSEHCPDRKLTKK